MMYKISLKIETEVICEMEAKDALEARDKVMEDLDNGGSKKERFYEQMIDNMEIVETRVIKDENNNNKEWVMGE